MKTEKENTPKEAVINKSTAAFSQIIQLTTHWGGDALIHFRTRVSSQLSQGDDNLITPNTFLKIHK